MPRGPTRKQILIGVAFVALSLGGLYIVLPAIAGLGDTWRRLDNGEPGWLTAGLFLEIASFFCYVALFRGVVGQEAGIGWAQSYRITLASLAATRLLAAGGVGGIALTAWALRRDGLRPTLVATRMATMLVLLYTVYMGAVVLSGLGLRTGVLTGPSPVAFTLIPATVAGLILIAGLVIGYFGGDLRQATSRLNHPSRWERWRAAMATVPNTLAEGVRGAIASLRERPLNGVWAIGWWGFDIAVLWACLHAFGTPPPVGVIVASYFIGMTANLLPLPGGIGGVEGGMIGALIAFDVPGGLAIVSVLSYRAFSFWLPTIPGALAYIGLLRREPARVATESGAVPAEMPVASFSERRG
jgi:putative heme transporter